MTRTIWLIPIGAITGSAAVLIASANLQPEPPVPTISPGAIEPDTGRDVAGDSFAAAGDFASRLEAHERATGTKDVTVLAQEIERLAAQTDSLQRDIQLQSYVAQLATRDPRSAARLAERLALGDDALATVFQIWAGSNTDEALPAIAGLSPPATRRSVALAMLEVLGPSMTTIDRIAAVFPPAEARSFRIDAIVPLAHFNLDAAIMAADALELPPVSEHPLAAPMARIDPRRGLEYATTFPAAFQRLRFRDALVDHWAKLDPDGLLAWMESTDLTQTPVSANGFRALATANPERLLALAERFGPQQRVNVQQAAFEALTALDPATAYDRVSSLPKSADRDRFIASVAQRYAAENPEAALAWVSSVEPRSSIAFNAVLSAVAVNNPVGVADVIVAEILNPTAANRAEMPSLVALLDEAMRAQSPGIAQIANKLASHDDPRIRMQLSQLVVRWPQADPDAAFAWVTRNPRNLNVDTLPQFSELLAIQSPSLARQGLQRMPADLREPWIEGSAGGMARSDLDGALEWIESFRDDPVYRNALDAVLNAAASTQPEAVAGHLDEDPQLRARLAPLVASSWAARDPQAAANWVSGMSTDEQAQLSDAAGRIASRWALSDAGAAERWVRDLPTGSARDEGLSGLLQAGANQGSVDVSLLDDFSSDDARARGVLNSIFALARTDAVLARELIDQHVRDPAQRAQAEAMLESASQRPTAINLSLPAGIGLVPGAAIRAPGGGTCIEVVNGNPSVVLC